MAEDDSAASDYVLFKYTGSADIPCPVCRVAGRDVTIAFLHKDHQSGVERIQEVIPVPSAIADPDDNGLPRMAGRFLTDVPDEVVGVTCPHPACGRRQEFTARGVARRLRHGLPLLAR